MSSAAPHHIHNSTVQPTPDSSPPTHPAPTHPPTQPAPSDVVSEDLVRRHPPTHPAPIPSPTHPAPIDVVSAALSVLSCRMSHTHTHHPPTHPTTHACKPTTRCLLAPTAPTDVVSTDLERLVLPHEEADLLVALVLQQPRLPHPALLPLVVLVVKPVELGLAAGWCVWGGGGLRCGQRAECGTAVVEEACRRGRPQLPPPVSCLARLLPTGGWAGGCTEHWSTASRHGCAQPGWGGHHAHPPARRTHASNSACSSSSPVLTSTSSS